VQLEEVVEAADALLARGLKPTIGTGTRPRGGGTRHQRRVLDPAQHAAPGAAPDWNSSNSGRPTPGLGLAGRDYLAQHVRTVTIRCLGRLESAGGWIALAWIQPGNRMTPEACISSHTGWIGALVVLTALALTAWSGRLDRARISSPSIDFNHPRTSS
jgi:hypothetical protein